ASSPTTDDGFALPALALDIGQARIGVAVCDRGGRISRPLTVISRRDRAWPEKVAALAHAYGCRGVVVGLPVHMDGTPSEQTEDVRRAVEELKRALPLPVRFQDERLSTFVAEQRLSERGIPARAQKEIVDAEAAAVILEDFLAAWRRCARS
ncbi:MAG: Holliday junction resolvase RuvX, partial [Zetaproteobacteria bacterium]